MLENTEYNIGREYEFYASIPEKQGRDSNFSQERITIQKADYKNNLTSGSTTCLEKEKEL